ncbi:MAG: hypothetical protein QW568_00805 [Candidatus Anstonellaceae archaeon]
MANVSVSVDEEIRRKMAQFAFVNWSQVARQAFAKKISDLEFLEKFKSDSTMTEEDALRLGAQVNHSLAKRLRKALLSRAKLSKKGQ